MSENSNNSYDNGFGPEKIEPGMDELLQSVEVMPKNKIVLGKVIAIQPERIVLDIGYKTDTFLDVGELKGKDGKPDLKLGDEIEVFVESGQHVDGHPFISYRKARAIRAWEYIQKNYETQTIINGKITKRTKGGVAVNLKGVEVFMPASQVGYPPQKNLDEVIGRVVPLRIIEFDRKRRNVVVSWRIVVETEVKEKRGELLEKISVGDVVWGRVRNITNFGAFVDLGGIDGLLRIDDISWGRVNKAGDFLKKGQEIEVKIIDFNREREQIALGLKQLLPYPWENVEEKYPIESIITGRVTGITNYGAFVELEEGVEGLIHIGDMSWANDVKHPKDILKTGNMVRVKILKVEKEQHRISLGLKQVKPNPWVEIKDKYPAGTRITRRVTNITSFGAFLEVEEGIEGLLHVSDISWTKKIKHPAQVLKRGEQVEVVVLNVDVNEEKISLGLKQKSANPYDKYHIGDNVCGKVVKILKNGAFVFLEPEIKGFIHISQVSMRRADNVRDVLGPGEKVWSKIKKVDQNEKQIDLSVKEYLKERERKEIEKYINQESQRITLGEILKEQMDSYEE